MKNYTQADMEFAQHLAAKYAERDAFPRVLRFRTVHRKPGYEIDGNPDGRTAMVMVDRIVRFSQDPNNKKITRVHLDNGEVVETCDSMEKLAKLIEGDQTESGNE